jgi:hypothetical protein
MSLQAFVSLMTHSILLRKRTRNSSGDFSDISNSSIPGFVEFGNELVTTEKGEKVQSTAIIYLKDDCGIDINWPYWMINQITPYTRNNMEVLKINPIDDPRNGKTHHFECYVR